MKRVVIIGAGFAGLSAAKRLRRVDGLEVTILDRRNHHLFQPLLYQVAMAGLSPADIAVPIRSVFARNRNVRVFQAEARSIDRDRRVVETDAGEYPYDYLLVAAGSGHNYLGHPEWQRVAPGLKSIEEAIEIRRRVLAAYEHAELSDDPEEVEHWLTFAIIGGGPTGVELAGAIAEMSRFTLARDFRRIDPRATRIVLVEAAPRLLPALSEQSSERARQDLEELGVEVLLESPVTAIDADGVSMEDERIPAKTVLWAAGVKPSEIGRRFAPETDKKGAVLVEDDLSLPGDSRVFVAGDLAHVEDEEGKPLPALAPVAMQQGRHVARTIERDLLGKTRRPFRYLDKGTMATIGRKRAVAEVGKIKLGGLFAWLAWLVVHIYYLIGFRNRVLVFLQWSWSYLTFRRGARLIVGNEETVTGRGPAPVEDEVATTTREDRTVASR